MNRKVGQYPKLQPASIAATGERASFARRAAMSALFATALGAFAACGGTDPQPPASSGGSTSTGGASSTGGTTGGGTTTSGGSTATGGTTGTLEVLLPFDVGDTWTYKITDTEDQSTSTKITTVYAKEAVGGDGPHKDVMAFRVETRKGDNGNDKTESWQLPLAENPQRVVRYRELAYSPSTGMPENEDYWDPYKIHIDGSPDKISKGQWPEEYKEFKKPTGGAVSSGGRIDLWKVVNADESVNVNGKTFEHSIHFMKTGNSDPDSVKEYWYVRGIGKVREAGSSQTEELISYTVGGKKGP